MHQNFRDYLHENLPFLIGKKIFVAVSGGLDSMVLLDLVSTIDFEIAVLHCNFNLRGHESLDDENFVRKNCIAKNINFFIKNFDTRHFAQASKLSTQVAARKLRYRWFNEKLEQEKFDFILTAHHLDDSLETFLINLSRGTGLDGLTGIPEINNKIVRPLLSFSRAEIELYANQNNIVWQEDSSNNSDKYLRNKIRHHIVPQLKLLNDNFLNNFQSTQNYLKQSNKILTVNFDEAFQRVVHQEGYDLYIDITKMLGYQNYETYLHNWLQPYQFKSWTDINNLVNAQNGKKIFSETHQILKYRNHLILSVVDDKECNDIFEINKNFDCSFLPINLSICKVKAFSEYSKNIIFVDENLVNFPLRLCFKNIDDIFYPAGMTGSKKVTKFLKDEKIDPNQRTKTWILKDANNQILWIVGHRQDRRFMANSNSKNILQLTFFK
ncbi:MAG: hypothetical protein RLZZ312_1846 [Bacteroidota bacterium]|jgi:tRNA(Ile)-lysidine synthase